MKYLLLPIFLFLMLGCAKNTTDKSRLPHRYGLSYQIAVLSNADSAIKTVSNLNIKLKKHHIYSSVKRHKNNSYKIIVSGFSSQNQAKSILGKYGYKKIIPYKNSSKKKVKQKKQLKKDNRSIARKKSTPQKPKVSKPVKSSKTKATQAPNTNQKQSKQKRVQDNKKTTTVVKKPSNKNIKSNKTKQYNQIEKNIASMCTPVIDAYSHSIKEKKDPRVINLAKKNRDKCLNRKKVLESQQK